MQALQEVIHMILDCPACGAVLMFDPETGKMKCEGCGSLFETYELSENFEKRGMGELNNTQRLRLAEPVTHGSDHHDDVEMDGMAEDGTMECSIYTCSACGAEIAVNDVEASTFCSYCGQPTLVFSRIAFTKKPKYIIPFSVTRDRAISLIRERLNKGFFVPNDIKNFEIERVRGIYVPFWLYDIYYYDQEYLRGTVGSGKSSRTYYYFREAECDFTRITLDASKQLNDETSQRLEPYDMGDIKEFSMEYLSGFYADCYDMQTAQLDGLAFARARSLFEQEVQKTIKAHSISILKSTPSFHVKKTEYAMFPAWFLTFRYEDIPYTLLVNGQTQKIIGGVPYDRAKMALCFGILSVLLSFLATWIVFSLMHNSDKDTYKLILNIILMSIFALAGGIGTLEKVKNSAKLTSLTETTRFVRDRQGED